MTLDTRPESAKIRLARKISGIALCNSAERVYNFKRQPNTHFLDGDPQSGPTGFPGRKPAHPQRVEPFNHPLPVHNLRQPNARATRRAGSVQCAYVQE